MDTVVSHPKGYHIKYNLDITHYDGWFYIDIQKGILVLKQAGNISNDRLCTHIDKYGYAPFWHTPALCKHEARYIIFTLVVDDFGIKFAIRQDVNHLSSSL